MSKLPNSVTIGLPVFNGGVQLEPVINSLLSQTHREFSLIISDNASTDQTEEICTRLAQRDSRIDYRRQDVNMGAELNFAFVLRAADTEYFMWAAADDVRSDDFLQRNLAFLQTHPDYLGSTCPVSFVGSSPDPYRMGDESRSEQNPPERILRYFSCWHANGSYYSLFRREALARSFDESRKYLGADWAVVIALLAMGKLNRLEEGWIRLGRGGISNSRKIFSIYRLSALNWIFPFWGLSLHALRLARGGSVTLRTKLSFRLLKLNLVAAILQLKYERELRRQRQ